MINLIWRVIRVYQKAKRSPGNEVGIYSLTLCKNSRYLKHALSRIIRYLEPYFQCITYWLIFNIFINDLIYTVLETEVCNFADGTTSYAFEMFSYISSWTTQIVLRTGLDWIAWLGNPAKFQLMILGTKYIRIKEAIYIDIHNICI